MPCRIILSSVIKSLVRKTCFDKLVNCWLVFFYKEVEKAMSTIYMLTSSFPYGGGEQFINTEVKYWDGRVTFAPLRKYGEIDRDLAGSVVDESLIELYSCEKKKYLTRAADIFFNRELYSELLRKPQVLLSIKKMKSLIKFLFISHAIKSSLLILVKGKKIEVMYSYWFSHGAMALSLLKKTYPDIKLVARGHGSDVYEYVWPNGYMPLGATYYKAFEKIYCVSEHGMNYLHSHFGVPGSYLEVSRLGIDGAVKAERQRRIADLHVVSVSRVIPLKRLDLLVDALYMYLQNNPGVDLKWTHIGSGEVFEAIKLKSENCNLNVNFLGEITNEAVYEFYMDAKVDVFINVSSSEGVPVAMMEAISFDIPIIATAVGGVPEIVTNESGILISKDFKTIELVRAIEDVNKLKFSPRNVFDNRYSANVNYVSFIGQITDVIDGK